MRHFYKIVQSICLFSVFMGASLSVKAGEEYEEFDVWPGLEIGSPDTAVQSDIENPAFGGQKDVLVWNVTRPTLTVVKPTGKANGAAVVIAPGGGFRVLSYGNEGMGTAKYLASKGFTCFILKYRLHPMPPSVDDIKKGMADMARRIDEMGSSGAGGRPRIPLGELERKAISDGVQAVKLVRTKAEEYGIDRDRVGIIGFSAGGTVSGHAAITPNEDERANFAGVIYSFVKGDIPTNAPPLFMAGATDDMLALGLTDVFDRWVKAGNSAELHIYAEGKHGFASMKQNLPVDNWKDGFYAWIRQQGFVE